MWFVLLAACAPESTDRITYGSHDDSAADDSATDDSAGDTSSAGPCPVGAVPVGDLCIDAWETTVTGDLGNTDQGADFPDGSTTATSTAVPGVIPTIHVTWYQAYATCAASGRHLCTVDEWQAACGSSTWPWGDSPNASEVCAVANADGTTKWTDTQPTGSLPSCVSPEGVYDQVGNAWEWADPGVTGDDGLPITAKLGGAWYAGAGDAACGIRAHDEHPPSFDGTIGFRCCSQGG